MSLLLIVPLDLSSPGETPSSHYPTALAISLHQAVFRSIRSLLSAHSLNFMYVCLWYRKCFLSFISLAVSLLGPYPMSFSVRRLSACHLTAALLTLRQCSQLYRCIANVTDYSSRKAAGWCNPAFASHRPYIVFPQLLAPLRIRALLQVSGEGRRAQFNPRVRRGIANWRTRRRPLATRRWPTIVAIQTEKERLANLQID